ncbi:putative viral A-type inclusion protein [Ostreococcus tauri virus OtV5]|uniref:Putative viral A-type inclusion protein n=1 Tax=Ostreococcus tauri virus OtV5 TaxID=1785753 RepID=A0A120HTH7_9PHYC|nr:putative viral A-type inclusion protein [Ostreococcus tauri virus OtV5]AMA76495.1 putative viral A-type inclusion protein [Ostreococcus tauri virus OtV5]
MNACDPDADIENLRKLIKLNTGVDIKLTKEEICEAYQDIQDGKLPLPPMVMNSTRTYLVDKKSPLKPNDYDQLFDATTKRADLKRIARKVDLKNVDQMTKSQIVDAIGKRLRYMKVHEPVKFARRRRVVSVNTAVNGMNNTAVNRVNNVSNTNVNRVNNTAVNNTAVNTNVNRANTTTNNYKMNTTTNNNYKVNTNNTNNYKMNTTTNNNYKVNTNNTNNYKMNTTTNNNYKVNTNNTNRPKNKNSKVTFPTGGLFAKGEKPKFLGGAARNGEKKKGFFASLFGKKENKNFIPANKFKNSKPGYSFYKGNEGLGYYKNTGGLQGPQLPPINDTKPVPTNDDFALELAVARVKQLGLKREQKFLNQIQLGQAKRKDIVAQAEAAKQEENQFASFLDGLDISNTNKNAFKRRMATDDLKQIQVEAQIKADEKANVARSNEEKMNMFLKTTSLNNTNKTLFLNKARANGSNINALIDEARQLNTRKKTEKLSKKQDEFRTILQNYNKLNATDKEALIKTVAETANVNTMRKMADDLVKKRMEEKKNATAQNLLSFLTPLQINQSNKNAFLRRFRNENVDINSIKTEALKLQESKGSANIEALRVKLETRLGELGLNQISQNSIMRKFRNGNRNVNKLIQEAKNLKAQKGATNLQEAKQEYRAFINDLPGLTNTDKAELTKNNAMNRNRAKQLSNNRLEQMKINSKQGFINFMTELGITNQYRDELLGNFNANRMTMNALKNKATKIAQKIKNDKNVELKTTLNTRLGELGLNQVNKNSIMRKFANGNRNVDRLIQEAKNLKSTRNTESMNAKRQEYAGYLNTLPGLTNEDKKTLLNSGNLSRNAAKQMSNKRLEQAKINSKKGFINFMTELGITNQYRDELLNNFNANRMTMNALKNKATKVAQKIKNDRNAELKTQLNTRLGELGLNQVNKNSIMRKFTNGNRNVNSLIQEAKNLKSTRNAENMNAKRKEYAAYLNTLPGLTNADRQSLLTDNNRNRNKAKTLSNQRVADQKEREREQFEKFLVNLGLDNGDRKTMVNKYNSNTLTVNALQKVAQELKNERVQQQKVANKKTLMEYLESANISRNAKINIERRFNTNQGNLRTLQLEVNKMVKEARNAKIANNKAKLASNVKGSILSNTDKNAFIRRLNDENANITALRSELNTMVTKMIETQRAKDRDELEEYMKTQGLSPENQKVVLNKFNVSNKIALTNLKQEANAILVSRIQQKRNANTGVLTNHGRKLGLTNQEIKNLTNKLNREKLEPLMNEANAIAKKKAQNQKNALNRAKSDYINKLGLNANNKRNILSQNLNLNATKALANQRLQNKIAEKRAKNMTKLGLHLNKLNLNNGEKRKFFNNFNRNVNLNTIMKNASNFESQKKAGIKAEQLADLKKFLNEQGLNAGEQRPFLNKLNKNQDDLAALKVEAKRVADQKFAKLKAQKRDQLVNVLKGLSNLTQNDINGILRNFDNTNVNTGVLSNRAREINKSRKDERYAQNEEEFYDYLNTLQNLTPENRTEITSKLNGYFTNWNAIKQLATNTAVGRAKQRREAEKANLNNHMTNLGFNNNSKRIFFKNLDDGKNLKVVKKDAVAYKKDLDAKRKAVARKGFSNLLNTLYINKSDRDALLEQFNDDTTGLNQLQNNAREREAKTINRNRGALTLYLADELKLNAPDVNLLLKNYNADPRSLNTLRNRGRQLKNARNEEERKEIRRQVKEYLNGLNLLNNKNKQNIINKNLPYKNAKAEGNKAQEFKRLAKRGAERNTLTNAIKNLPNADKKDLLNKFNTRNVTLNSMLNEAKDLKAKRIAEKRARERTELYNALNGLNMNVADRNAIMNKFNKSNATVNTLRNEAVKLRNQRIAQKRSQNRDELEAILNGTNLNASNKTSILNKFNSNKNATLTSLRATIEELSKQRRVEKRLATRVEVERYLKKVGLTNADTKTVLNKFNADNSISLKNASDEANAILIQRVTEKMAQNRENLVQHMNGLNITNANRAAILKNFDSEAASLNNLKNRATQINTAIKTKAAQRRELSNYINSLGVNGKELLNKFNNGRSNVNSIKKEADEIRKEMNAKIVNTKRDELNQYMTNTFIPTQNRKAFLNRITVNTNMNSIKSNVKNMDNSIRAKKEQEAKNRDNFSVFLNGLELTNKEKSDLLKNYNGGKTNVRNRALSINAAVKAKAAQRRELSNYINTLGINGKALLNKFNNGRSTLDNLKKEADKAKALANAKTVAAKKAEIVAYAKNFDIPKSNKNSFANTVELNTNLNTIKRSIKELNKVIKNKKEQEARNRDDFSVFLNGLELTNKEKSGLLKNYNGGKTNVRNRALSINAAVKAKAAQRQELSNYINALGINGKALLNKFNSGRSTLDKLKKDADKARALLNAKAVNAKKDDLRAYMKETRLPNTNKQSFLNRVELNTNMNTIKREIRELNAVLKGRNDEFARKKSELSVYLNGLNDLTSNQRTSLLKKVTNANTNIQSLKNEGNALNREAKNKRAAQAAAEEEKKRKEAEAKKLQDEKKLEKHLLGLKHLTSKEMEGYMSNFKNGEALIDDLIAASKAKNADNEKDKDALRNYVRKATIPQTKKDVYLKQLNTPYVNATPIKGLVNANAAAQKKEMEKLIKNAEAKLKTISNITANERGRFKIRLQKESVSNVLQEAEKLGSNRRNAKKARDQEMKNVASKLQGLTSLQRENRKKFMNRLATNGAQKVVSNATILDKERKMIEDRKKAEEAKKKAEEAKKKMQNMQTKRLATKLQGLTSLQRENRKKFMNRLATNGTQKVLANAQALNGERKKTREGIELKLKKIGVKGSNLQGLLKRWNNSQNKTIWNDARAMVAKKREPLLKRIERNVPRQTNFAQGRVKWAAAIKDAKDDTEVAKIEKLLDDKLKLKARAEREVANLPSKQQTQYLQNIMAYKNDVADRTQKLNQLAKTKRETKDKATKEVSQKLQSLTKLERENRKKFMNRVAGGESANKVVANADKLQRNRLAAERVKQQKAEQEKKALEERKRREEEEKKRKDQEKAKQAKLRANTAKMFQSMNGLERKNRKEFMERLERGNDPAKVIANARARDQMKKKPQNFTFNKRPANQIKTMTAAERFGTPTKNRSTTGKSLKQKEADNMRKRREAQQKQRAKSKKRR